MRNHFIHGLRGLALVLTLCLSLAGGAFAQEETAATITGQVTDSTGAVIPGATVIVSNNETKTERRVQTNDDGLYVVTPLAPGTYEVTVEQANFKRAVQTGVTLNAKDRRPINVVLEAGLASEVVTVTSESQTVQDTPTGQGLVSGAQVRELPLVNRDFLKLLESGIPGVSSDLADETSLGLTNRTSVSINGMRRNGVNYLVDGVNNVDGGSNITLLTTPTIDSIQEFKVLTSNYTAEVGRSGSGTVTLVTRGGSNNFHGTLYEFARNDRFNSNSFFNNRVPRRADGRRAPGTATPRLRYNNFGGTVSGPVYLPHFGEGGPHLYNGKDKTFFFYSEEFRRIRRGTTSTTALVPTEAQRRGDFSSSLGLPLFRTTAGTGSCTGGTGCTTTPLFVTDTNGQTIQARAGQVFNAAGLAFAGNIIPTSLIDPSATALLAAYPLPNAGLNAFTFSAVARQNTRQEVARVDHSFNDNQRLFGRYTHDLSQTTEPAGLFNSINLPNIGTTATNIPGQVLAISLTSVLSPQTVNEVAYNFSQNHIVATLIGRGRRADYPGLNIPEFYPENNIGAIPTVSISGIQTVGSAQQPDILYRNNLVRDVFTWTRGNHTMKFGGEAAFEKKNENVGTSANTQGSFAFTNVGSRGRSGTITLTQTGVGLASFLLGRADSYSESEFDVTNLLDFGRREFFGQDTWKVRPNLTLDFGVRYQYFIPPVDKNNLETSFIPALFDPAQVPTCTTPLCASLVRGTGNPLNGIAIAGRNSPFGRTIYPRDKNNFSPRVGLAYDPFKDGRTIIRAGYGFYYDQIASFLVEDPDFTNPPFVNSASFSTNATLANPTGGVSSVTGALPILGAFGINPDFRTPEIQQWSLGVQRQVFRNAVIDISYVGTRGDHLLRQRNINFVTPAAASAFSAANAGSTNFNSIRPFRGFGNIAFYETAARSRYHGLLSSFNYRFAKSNTLSIAYTFSKNLTDFTNDRDAVDAPQNPFNPTIEYAEARTSRPHIFSASYIYEIPFFEKSEGLLHTLFYGFQISGITNIESGSPISRILASTTNGGTNGNRAQLIGDPRSGANNTVDPVTGLPFYYDPAAFANPAPGTFGNSGRAILRNPGRNQTNLRLARNFYFNRDKGRYMKLLGEAINAFNHTQFTVIQNQLGLSNTGRPTGARLPREFQFAMKLYF